MENERKDLIWMSIVSIVMIPLFFLMPSLALTIVYKSGGSGVAFIFFYLIVQFFFAVYPMATKKIEKKYLSIIGIVGASLGTLMMVFAGLFS